MTRTKGYLCWLLLLAPAAQAQLPDDREAALGAQCAALPAVEQAACFEEVEAAAPGEQARMREMRDETSAYDARLASALAAQGAPRDLAFAATLRSFATRGTQAPPARDNGVASQPVPDDPQLAAWRRDAFARAGSDVIAHVLLAQSDASGDGARLRAEAAARWQSLEPDNLAPAFFAPVSVETLLAAARDRRRFDLHMYEQVRWMQSAYVRHAPADAMLGELSAEGFGAIAASGIWAAVAIPALQPLAEACREPALDAAPTRRDDCRAIARLMADASDTGLGTMIGIGLLGRVASNEAERAEAAQRQRRFDWQMQNWSMIASRQPQGGAAEFARLLRDASIQREQQLVERVLREAGVPLDPPAGWEGRSRE
jgi:hypothetical protein